MRTKILSATVAFLLLGSVAAYAYVAATATATITVSEALYIDSAGIQKGLNPFTPCAISSDKASATCSIAAYPGESGSVGIMINNRSSVALATTESASSSSADVSLTMTTASASVPGGSGTFFVTTFTVSPSATPGTVTISISFSR